jgi:hypothetical protein
MILVFNWTVHGQHYESSDTFCTCSNNFFDTVLYFCTSLRSITVIMYYNSSCTCERSLRRSFHSHASLFGYTGMDYYLLFILRHNRTIGGILNIQKIRGVSLWAIQHGKGSRCQSIEYKSKIHPNKLQIIRHRSNRHS